MSGTTIALPGVAGGTWIPDHLSQLHQLKANGSTGAAWPQLWGRDYDGLNCGYTVGAIGAAFATRGAWMPAPNDLRELAKDREGGCMPADLRRAIHASGRVPDRLVTVPRGGLSWARMVELREAGYYLAVATDYELIADERSCQASFDGDHMLGLPPIPPKADGQASADDPLCNHRKQYPEAELRAAARKCANSWNSEGLMVVVFGQDPVLAKPDPDALRIRELELQVRERDARLEAIAKLAAPAAPDPAG